jgi:hypothetical protein
VHVYLLQQPKPSSFVFRSIGDNDAPDVAETFYAHLFKNGTNSNPDTTEAARALHLAVKKLRMKRQGITFRQWVPFIHLGI